MSILPWPAHRYRYQRFPPGCDDKIDDQSAARLFARSTKVDQATALQTGRCAFPGLGVAPRDQVRWISHARPPGPWQGLAADADRPGLDAQVPFHSRGRVGSAGKTGLSRWRAMRHYPRWEDLVQLDPDGFGFR